MADLGWTEHISQIEFANHLEFLDELRADLDYFSFEYPKWKHLSDPLVKEIEKYLESTTKEH